MSLVALLADFLNFEQLELAIFLIEVVLVPLEIGLIGDHVVDPGHEGDPGYAVVAVDPGEQLRDRQ